MKPDCYKCQYRGEVPGSAHSSCRHPQSGLVGADPLSQILGLLSSVGRCAPPLTKSPLTIVANPHGVRCGWFSWPFTFDPIWLEACDGFTPKGGEMDGKSQHAPDAGSAPSVLQRNERDEIDERPIT